MSAVELLADTRVEVGEEEEEVGAARLSCDAIVSDSSALSLLAGPAMLGGRG